MATWATTRELCSDEDLDEIERSDAFEQSPLVQRLVAALHLIRTPLPRQGDLIPSTAPFEVGQACKVVALADRESKADKYLGAVGVVAAVVPERKDRPATPTITLRFPDGTEDGFWREELAR